VSDQLDDVNEVTVSEATMEEVVSETFTNDEANVSANTAETVSVPTPTIVMEVTPTGERRLSRRQRWLQDLNRAIAEHPTSPTNYVLRGELALDTKDYGQAAADFEKALELGSAQVETATWGIVAQTMQDRAYAGLAKANRHISGK
jgi:hypothetical protein